MHDFKKEFRGVFFSGDLIDLLEENTILVELVFSLFLYLIKHLS